MNYSVAGHKGPLCDALALQYTHMHRSTSGEGLVALPREVSGELSAATSFEVKGLKAGMILGKAVANDQTAVTGRTRG